MPKRKPAARPASLSKNLSAGLLMFRGTVRELEVFLAHPGGPFWARKEIGAWTIPKGLVEVGEEPLIAAIREFHEETGITPAGPYFSLGIIRQKAGKTVHAWAFAGEADPAEMKSNVVSLRTGAGWRTFPEIDRCEWFVPQDAREKLNPAQAPLVDRLIAVLMAEGR